MTDEQIRTALVYMTQVFRLALLVVLILGLTVGFTIGYVVFHKRVLSSASGNHDAVESFQR